MFKLYWYLLMSGMRIKIIIPPKKNPNYLRNKARNSKQVAKTKAISFTFCSKSSNVLIR